MMVCLTCGRVRPASKRSEYTAERGALVAQRGLCICATPAPPCTRAVQSLDLPPEAATLAAERPVEVLVEDRPVEVCALTDELSAEPVTSAGSAA